MNNEYLATFVDELYQLGVREAVFSPGSRSTALALLFEHYGKFTTFVNIDERSAAFFALGIAKGNERPVVVVCTSGSAGAHHFPAVVEAKFSHVPLIILTADRPSELQFVGAPQTIDQTRLFGDFVTHFETLQPPAPKDFWTYPRKVAQRAYLGSLKNACGPVQINVPLRDPLIPDLNAENYEKGRPTHPFRLLSTKDFPQPLLSGKTLILAGPDASSTYQEALIALSEELHAPIVADPLSNLRNFAHKNIMDSYDAFLTSKEVQNTLQADTILLFGQMPVSKRLQQFVGAFQKSEFIQIDPLLDYRNSSQTTTALVKSDVLSFLSTIDTTNIQNKDTSYLRLWQNFQSKMRAKLDTVSAETQPFEGHLVQLLQKMMPENSQLLISNSMEIRDVDYFWKAKHQSVKLFGNRGVNGIDGTESTALGLSTTGKATVLLTGDLSMLHDMNGLIVGKTEQLNLTIILFNNDGGGIFHHLAQNGVPHFDYLFSTPHSLDFSGLERLVNLDYHLIENDADFESFFRHSIQNNGVHLLEIKTDKTKSLALHQKYTNYED